MLSSFALILLIGLTLQTHGAKRKFRDVDDPLSAPPATPAPPPVQAATQPPNRATPASQTCYDCQDEDGEDDQPEPKKPAVKSTQPAPPVPSPSSPTTTTSESSSQADSAPKREPKKNRRLYEDDPDVEEEESSDFSKYFDNPTLVLVGATSLMGGFIIFMLSLLCAKGRPQQSQEQVQQDQSHSHQAADPTGVNNHLALLNPQRQRLLEEAEHERRERMQAEVANIIAHSDDGPEQLLALIERAGVSQHPEVRRIFNQANDRLLEASVAKVEQHHAIVRDEALRNLRQQLEAQNVPETERRSRELDLQSQLIRDQAAKNLDVQQQNAMLIHRRRERDLLFQYQQKIDTQRHEVEQERLRVEAFTAELSVRRDRDNLRETFRGNANKRMEKDSSFIRTLTWVQGVIVAVIVVVLFVETATGNPCVVDPVSHHAWSWFPSSFDPRSLLEYYANHFYCLFQSYYQSLVRLLFYSVIIICAVLWSSHGTIVRPLTFLILIFFGKSLFTHYLVVLVPIALNLVFLFVIEYQSERELNNALFYINTITPDLFPRVVTDDSYLEWRSPRGIFPWRKLFVHVLFPIISSMVAYSSCCWAVNVDPVTFAMSYFVE